MRPAYDHPQALKAQILAQVGRGWRLHQIAATEGMPSRATIQRWRRADPGFAAELATCRMYARGLRWESRGWFRYDYAEAERFLAHVARVGMKAAVRTPGQACTNQVNRWKKVRPEFAAELEAAKARWPRPKRRRRVLDDATSDRIILLLMKGVRLRALRQADPTLPGVPVVRAWRAADPAFDGAVRMAMRGSHRQKVRAANRRPDLPPGLTDRIVSLMARGARLSEIGRMQGMPSARALYARARADGDFARALRLGRDLRDQAEIEAVLDLARAVTPDTLGRTQAEIRRLRRRLDQPSRDQLARGSERA